MPLRVRALFDAVGILKDGICPDARDPFTHIRTSDTVRDGNSAYHPIIGGFAHRDGVKVLLSYVDRDYFGVVPVGLSEGSAAIGT